MERKELFQYQRTISVPREPFIKTIIENEGLSKDDLRVCMLLLTELDGWAYDRKFVRAGAVDPMNYKGIDLKSIAESLNMKKKDVKRSIETLIRDEIIEEGGSRASSEGYRFTF